jgi:hypothetical protein
LRVEVKDVLIHIHYPSIWAIPIYLFAKLPCKRIPTSLSAQ